MATREECEAWKVREASPKEAVDLVWTLANGDYPTMVGAIAGALDKIVALEARIAILETDKASKDSTEDEADQIHDDIMRDDPWGDYGQ